MGKNTLEDGTHNYIAVELLKLYNDLPPEKYFCEIDSLIKRKEFYKEIDKSKTLSKQEAFNFFKNCHCTIQNYLDEFIQKRSSVAWLWYLRRVPDKIFSLKSSSLVTANRTRLLAEILTSRSISCKSELLTEETNLVFKINSKIIAEIYKFCLAINYLYQVEVNMRLAGKGAKFKFDKSAHFSKVLPSSILSNKLNNAVNTYDNRLEEKQGIDFSSCGTSVGELLNKRNLMNIKPESVILGVNPLKELMDVDLGFIKIKAKYSPVLINLNRLSDLLKKISFMSDRAETIGAILMLLSLFIETIFNSQKTLYNIFNVGYFLTNNATFSKQIHNSVKHILCELKNSFKGVIFPETLEELFLLVEECIYPNILPVTASSIIRREKDIIIIDLVAATRWLGLLLDLSTLTGNEANIRGVHFENTVQQIIDDTKWKPSENIRSYRRIQLRKRNGDYLTDIDAIGEKNDQLLIVSCKSIALSKGYDVGNYNTVRNARTTVEKAVEKWLKVKKYLKKYAFGRNYDFSKFIDIISVVCTPSIIFVSNKNALGFERKGLRKSVSLNELKIWLENN